MPTVAVMLVLTARRYTDHVSGDQTALGIHCLSMYDTSFTSLVARLLSVSNDDGDDRDLCPYNLLKCIRL